MGSKPTPTKYRIELGLRIKRARQKKFRTAKEAAEKYSVSQSMWTEMEKGRVVFSPEKIIEIAKFLNVTAGWLLTGEVESAPVKSSAEADSGSFRLISDYFSTLSQLGQLAGVIGDPRHRVWAEHAVQALGSLYRRGLEKDREESEQDKNQSVG